MLASLPPASATQRNALNDKAILETQSIIARLVNLSHDHRVEPLPAGDIPSDLLPFLRVDGFALISTVLLVFHVEADFERQQDSRRAALAVGRPSMRPHRPE